MLTTILTALMLTATPGAAARDHKTHDTMLAMTPGVSQQLAQERTRRVSGVTYRLGFHIPDSEKESVRFQDTVRFTLSDTQAPLLLDFAGKTVGSADARTHGVGNGVDKGEDRLCTVTVNGRRRKATLRDEHIVLQRRWLRRGENTVIVEGESSDEALNRHADYMYTLFVPAAARTAFACFDQPDLKARFSVSLSMPEGWKSISTVSDREVSTYLFSFTAGRFSEYRETLGGREYRALYRETDPDKTAQLPDIVREAHESVEWMERYTGIAVPFSRYGMALLPGYQFGGMEHPGAIQYKATTMFLPKQPTVADRLARIKLIAHETAHLWFGDMVTMRWFNDVWTKEVYANFLADKVGRQIYPEVDSRLNFLKQYYVAALSTDATPGTHPIQQPLANLNQAGLLYGNIIYNKAPVMMQKLEERMGEEALRRGLQAYLRRYAYANATWDELIHILDSVGQGADVVGFDREWVKGKGAPRRRLAPGEALGHDFYGITEMTREQVAEAVKVAESTGSTGVAADRFYALLALHYHYREVARPHTEEYSRGQAEWSRLLLRVIGQEQNELIASQAISWLAATLPWLADGDRRHAEERVMEMVEGALPVSVRRQLLRTMCTAMTSPKGQAYIYKVWREHRHPLLTARNLTAMSQRLAIMMPGRADSILTAERAYIKNADELAAFDFCRPACSPSREVRDRLFALLLTPQGRTTETWARSALALLCHETRGEEAVSRIVPALGVLADIQRTGSIFFPQHWLTSLLARQKASAQATAALRQWLDAHGHELLPSLELKVREHVK